MEKTSRSKSPFSLDIGFQVKSKARWKDPDRTDSAAALAPPCTHVHISTCRPLRKDPHGSVALSCVQPTSPSSCPSTNTHPPQKQTGLYPLGWSGHLKQTPGGGDAKVEAMTEAAEHGWLEPGLSQHSCAGPKPEEEPYTHKTREENGECKALWWQRSKLFWARVTASSHGRRLRNGCIFSPHSPSIT